MKENPIAFFDSGIGGSTILKEVIKELPNENYIYFPDSKNNPYGNKSKEELFKIVDNVVKKLIKYKPKMIVCACNTATAMVLNDIRNKYKDIIFIGTEPAIKVINDNYKDKKTIILTTKGTAESEKFNELMNKYSNKNTKLVMVKELASLIENNKETYKYLKENLEKYKGTEIVVLGCTHFPLVKEDIKKILGNVIFIDGSKGITKRIKYFLENNNNFNMSKENGYLKILENIDKEDQILSIVRFKKR